MNEIEENEFAEVEEKLKNTAENIEVSSFDEHMNAIRPQLRKKKRLFTPMVKRMVAAAASVILILAVGLTVYFSVGRETEEEYLYGDDDITISKTLKSEVEDASALAILNLDILFNDSYQIATHKESLETVYYKIEGLNMEDSIFRDISLTVIVEPKYVLPDESNIYDGEEVTILGIEMTINDLDTFVAPFYRYQVGFTYQNVRYYFEYKTSSEENDIESFMQQFLKLQ